MTSPIDWERARVVAARLDGGGPPMGRAEAADVVEALRRASLAAYEPVVATACLDASSPAAAVVVDRGRWVGQALASFAPLVDPVARRALERRDRQIGERALKAGRLVGGVEVGAVLGYLSRRVLGQYDPALGRGDEHARLLLVAPNIVEAERELGVDPDDFRLWVCLHEETHRVQFATAPWLKGHLEGLVARLGESLVPDPDRWGETLRRVAVNLRSRSSAGMGGPTDLLLDEQGRAVVEEVTAVMSLLEGHADVVMDAVGPRIVPSVEVIREQFQRRRRAQGPIDLIVRRAVGLDRKTEQYARGAAFVRGVQERVGIDGFNVVWRSPDTAPRPDEIGDPAAWVARVHG